MTSSLQHKVLFKKNKRENKNDDLGIIKHLMHCPILTNTQCVPWLSLTAAGMSE